MTHTLWSQDFFAKGELSPLMYSRVTLNAYYQGLKRAKNVLCYPQGSAGKRFGTYFTNELTGLTNYRQIYFEAFPYLDECCYLVVISNDTIQVYLEGFLTATVTGTGIMADEVRLIDHTIIENRFRVSTGIYRPKDLIRTSLAPNAITGVTANTFTLTSATLTNGGVYPVRFTAAAMPVTSPQIHASKTYFLRATSSSSGALFTTAFEAAAGINAYTISTAGTSANMLVLNNWSFSNVSFRNLPVFDFTGGYDAINFTPSAVSGNPTVTLAASGNIFTSAHVGGSFKGGGGLGRITAVGAPNSCTLALLQPFASTNAIPGAVCFLTQPAWSDTLGWPRKCSSFQNRAFFANTDTLPNGLWGSVVNDFDDFDDVDVDDDDSAISWFPTSDTVNYIQFIVPYRSLTIHTNSGVYSTPLSVETAITPNNFSLSLQDSTPAEAVQPHGIDNQIIVLSGNDAHSLLWDGFNNAYTSNIISIANEQLIRTPIDEAAYVDQTRAGSRYMFIINEDGTMAIYQTLISENVSGFTPAVLEQSYGNAYFRWVTSNFDGRAWFVTEREIAVPSAPVSITANTSDSFQATGVNLSTSTFTAVVFTATAFPTTSPQIEGSTIYWAVGVDANNFKVYLSQEDAENDDNAITITNIGTSASVIPYPLQTKLYIEQLSFDVEVDCAGVYSGSPVSSFGGFPRFNAQEVLMQGDGFGFETIGVNSTINFEAHGEPVSVSAAQIGFPIDVEITPMPLSISATGNPKSSNLVETKHIRSVTFLFADTIGGTIINGNNEVPIQMKTLLQTIPGDPPTPQTGTFEISLFGGWNDFKYNSFTINHREPFGFKLTGIFYKVDT